MAPHAPLRRHVRFGNFELDLRSSELRKAGAHVALPEQSMQILKALIEEPGELVTREQLRARLWPADTFVDFEHGLNAAVRRLRVALGDSADKPRYIETLPRRGYRFIAAVEGALDAGPDSSRTHDAAVRHDGSPPQRDAMHSATLTPRAFAVAGGVVLLAFAIATFVLSERRVGPAPDATAERIHLAVLPLQPQTPIDPRMRYLQIGVPDSIITRLAAIRALRLRPTSAVRRFASVEVDAKAAGELLGVEHVLAGTIREHAAGYRLNLQLIRTADGVTVWGGQYEVQGDNLLNIQDDSVAEEVARALRVTLTEAERMRMHRRYTGNVAAYAEFLKGRALLVDYTETRMRAAIEHFEAALARDPQYALARASLATALSSFSVRYAPEQEAEAWSARAEREATEALAQDRDLAEAHLALASTAGTVHRGFDWARVLEHTSAALSLDATLHLAHSERGRALFHLGLFREAVAAIDAAMDLTGEAGVENKRILMYVSLFGGEYAAALERAEEIRRLTDAVAIPTQAALAAYYLGDPPAALKVLRSIRRAGRPDVRAQAVLASIEAAEGNHAASRALVQQIVAQPYRDHHIAYSLAAAQAQLGELDTALRWLREAADTGFPCYPWFERDPLLEPLRRSPQYRAFASEMRRRFEVASARYGG